MSRVLLLGTFPPPVHGMSAINQALWKRFQASGLEVEKLDTSPSSLKRDIFSRLSRIKGVFSAWSELLKVEPHQDTLYIALSGGWGQVYDIVSLALARAKRMQRIIHHHSFAYLRCKRWLASLLISVAGRDSSHVLLCPEMEHLFRKNYGVRGVLLLSNLAFSRPDISSCVKREVHAAGFLSNITTAKGADEIIALAYSMREKRIPVKMIIAGPCLDNALAKRLCRAEEDGVLAWRGGVYGMDKIRFWQDIDVFIFPTQYENEAEPLVVFEALAAGLPVITYQRGCICEQVGEAGVVIPPDEDFITRTTTLLSTWNDTPEDYRYYVQKSRERYWDLVSEGEDQWKELLRVIEGGSQ